jgi:hypothetical protein
MKSKQKIEKWMRDEVSNPMIGKLIMNMTEEGVPMDEIMEIMQPIINNTPNVEEQLVGKYMRIQEGDSILADIEKFNKIADENEFSTDWSLYEIEDLSLKSPFKGKWMSKDGDINSDIRVKLPNRKLTWLELWEYADKLYNKLGDIEHRFIESFEVKGDTIEVFFGS